MSLIEIPTRRPFTESPIIPSEILISEPLDFHGNSLTNLGPIKELIIIPPTLGPGGIIGNDGGTPAGGLIYGMNDPAFTRYTNAKDGGSFQMSRASVSDADTYGARFYWFKPRGATMTNLRWEWLGMYPVGSVSGTQPYSAICLNPRGVYATAGGTLQGSNNAYLSALTIEHHSGVTASIAPVLCLRHRTVDSNGVLQSSAVGFGTSLVMEVQSPSPGGTLGTTGIFALKSVISAVTGGNAVDTVDVGFFPWNNNSSGQVECLRIRGVSGTAIQGINILGNNLEGNTTSGGTLTLTSTSNATKGQVIIASGSPLKVNDNIGVAVDPSAYNTYAFAANGRLILVSSNSDTNEANIQVAVASTTENGSVSFNRARNTQASPSDIVAGDQLGSFLGSGYKNGSYRLGAGVSFSSPTLYASDIDGQIDLVVRDGNAATDNFVITVLKELATINYGFATASTSPAQITADQNNYAIGSGSFFRLSTDAARTLTGLTGGVAGKHLYISNVGSFNLILANQNASSSAANRIITGTGADLTLSADDTVHAIYDSTTSRWRVIST